MPKKRWTESSVKSVLTKKQWDEFFTRLEGSEGCNFSKKSGKIKWKCSSSSNRPLAKKILTKMGLQKKIDDVLAFCEEHGGYCDCEILFNVAK